MFCAGALQLCPTDYSIPLQRGAPGNFTTFPGARVVLLACYQHWVRMRGFVTPTVIPQPASRHMVKFRAMLRFPDIDPVALTFGPIKIHWYGLAYLAGIGLAWWLLHRRAGRGRLSLTTNEVGDLVFVVALGAVIGGRIGYAVFYNFASFLERPWEIFAIWHGGMSFHGGVIGFVTAVWWYAYRTGHSFLSVTDILVPVVPVGLFLGRLANFINQELWGAPSSVPWAVLFTHPAAGGVARHPTQLYEAGLEGVALFVLLELVRRSPPREGILSALFLIGYGASRFAVEFVRVPDAHIGYLAWGWLTMGQVLSLPMIAAGVFILVFFSNRSARFLKATEQELK